MNLQTFGTLLSLRPMGARPFETLAYISLPDRQALRSPGQWRDECIVTVTFGDVGRIDLMWAPAPSRRAGALGGRHRCRGSADTVDIAPPERHARAPISWTITTVIVRRMRPTTQLHRHRFEEQHGSKS